MRTLTRGLLAVGLLAAGYLLGASGFVASPAVHAQQAAGAGQMSENTANKVAEARNALAAAMIALQNENLYNPATKGVNTFLVAGGGGDAIADLESGRGVDPETFAALYADLAIDDIARHLSKDDQGRLLYKEKLIRIYPVSRLKDRFARIAGGEQ